ncbi:MAG: pyridoxal phosphate-dependent aminotransferase [Bacteroidetes bacterium]|nr:MAG: pyridoxal phosphate-dependent aminotransferase [Bacteroidota bacterium]RLD78855.1 MAG: pyridoxal phosphate-dependent aminotransferase [Bacteroidota bacterium]
MPKLSTRANKMPASPIRKLVPYAEAAKKKGKKVYHLNIGQPDIHSPQESLLAIRNHDAKVIEYSHSAGNETYRRGLAKYYQNIGIDVDHNEIMITTGGSEAIVFAMLACLNPGDEIIVPEPYYTNYSGFANQAGIEVVPITSKIEDGFALPPISEFENVITDKSKAIIICNPNNPTGYLYSKEELYQLKELVLKYDLYIFADEVYREFVYDGLEHFSAMKIEGLEQNVVLFDSVSKRYSMCGVRTGALVTKNKDVYESAVKYGQARLSPPSLGQLAGEAALETPKEYFDNVYDEYIKRRNFVIEELNKIDGVYAPMPKGAFYSIIQLPVEDAEDFCQWLLEDFDYQNETVMLAPANGFYATAGLGKNEARIAYVLKIEDLKKAVKVLEEALKVYKK